MAQDEVAAQIQHGAASAIAAGVRVPWPVEIRNGRPYWIVRYCYTNQDHRHFLDCAVKRALARWRLKLDSPAFNATTNLVWEETHDSSPDRALRKPHYCYVVDNEGRFVLSKEGRMQWNINNVPGDTLWISINNKGGNKDAIATIGYEKVEDPDDPVNWGRHSMLLGRRGKVSSIIHEFGHVFGMIHEASRSDRDDRVLYKCENIDNYDNILARVMADYPDLSKTQAHNVLCHNKAFADSYGFMSGEFAKMPAGYDEPTGFDLGSVMLYESLAFARRECWHDRSYCPLVKYSRTGGLPDRNRPISMIELNIDPSDGDAKFLQRWYPAFRAPISTSRTPASSSPVAASSSQTLTSSSESPTPST